MAAPGDSVVAYPLRCIEWLWLSRTLSRGGIRTRFVSLHADRRILESPPGGRVLSEAEMARAAEMALQGYGRRPFADVTLSTDHPDPRIALDRLEIWARAVR